MFYLGLSAETIHSCIHQSNLLNLLYVVGILGGKKLHYVFKMTIAVCNIVITTEAVSA